MQEDFDLYNRKNYELNINNGLQISAEKSSVTIFTRHNVTQNTNIQLGRFSFPYKTSVKYLGVTFDKKLTWKTHIENILGRCESAINFMKMITKVWWGADPKISLTFYRSYVRSIINYGCLLYGAANQTTLKKLDILQNKALRICIGAMRSTPIGALLTE